MFVGVYTIQNSVAVLCRWVQYETLYLSEIAIDLQGDLGFSKDPAFLEVMRAIALDKEALQSLDSKYEILQPLWRLSVFDVLGNPEEYELDEPAVLEDSDAEEVPQVAEGLLQAESYSFKPESTPTNIGLRLIEHDPDWRNAIEQAIPDFVKISTFFGHDRPLL
ncbi:hypothetical protein AX16_000339 [Volvariella volvacea WC 439]|nr:hypothetical protein AX16_000339 [Volvariella volvacea WC 439]